MKRIQAISAVLLAVLVLVSSTSFMVGMHLCNGEVQSIALFGKADSCEKEQSLPPCHRHEKAPCCDDQTIVHKADDFKLSVTKHNIIGPVILTLGQPLIIVSEIIPSAPHSRTQYADYDPPLRSPDLTVEHNVFLI